MPRCVPHAETLAVAGKVMSTRGSWDGDGVQSLIAKIFTLLFNHDSNVNVNP